MTEESKPYAGAGMSAHRPSLVDVLETFLGTDIKHLKPADLDALSKPQVDALVHEIDRFLAGVAEGAFAEDAIALDGFASPIILPFDGSEPRTTRRAKQVALAHSEIIFPIEEFSLNYNKFGRAHLNSLCQWLRKNEILLRSHVFTLTKVPDLFDIFDISEITDTADEIIDILSTSSNEVFLDSVLPQWRTLGRDPLLAALNSLIYVTLQDVGASASFGTNLSFTHEPGGRIYEFCAQKTSGTSSKSGLFSHTALLHDLELPAIDDLTDDDFVGIRLHSEDFEQFRSVLERSLRKVARQVEDGREMNEAFHANTDEIRFQAELLRLDVRDKHLKKFLRTTAQNVTIGSFTSTAAAAAGSPPQTTMDLQLLAARFGVSAALGTLFALLLYQPPKRKQRLLRFYDILLADRRPTPG